MCGTPTASHAHRSGLQSSPSQSQLLGELRLILLLRHLAGELIGTQHVGRRDLARMRRHDRLHLAERDAEGA